MANVTVGGIVVLAFLLAVFSYVIIDVAVVGIETIKDIYEENEES